MTEVTPTHYKDRYVIQECFDGLYELKKTSGSFWNQIECSKSICSQVIRVNVLQNRGKTRPYVKVHEPFHPQEGSLSMVYVYSTYLVGTN